LFWCSWNSGGNLVINGGGAGNGGGFDTDSGEENGRCSPLLQQASAKYLLPVPHYQDSQRKCMVIDLDETLVHSSFKVRIDVVFRRFVSWHTFLERVPSYSPALNEVYPFPQHLAAS
jgi:hypothetical protein